MISVSNYLQFSMVCKSWHSIAKDNMPRYHDKLSSVPMQLIPTGRNGIWRLYNVMDDKLLSLQLDISTKRFCGCSKGWLIGVDESFTVTLINPLFRLKGTRKREKSIIRLPPLNPASWGGSGPGVFDCNYGVHKATISADPILHANDCIVLVIYEDSCRLAFIRLNKDTTWTYFEHAGGIYEIVHIRDKFYAIDNLSQLLSFDMTARFDSDIKLLGREIPQETFKKLYLVNLNEKELLMVERYIEHDFEVAFKRVTTKFEVFKFDYDKCKWIKKKSLGDFALFLGDNSSIAVLASSISGCQSDCIYFNHD
ncbi:F-box protein SKIP23-like [Prunus yedoensis var. nudiflora]|uniref:F-box protein SKIP23-like n=1 Tax=Prunus yedoensis var. nudiflora TaxID=2094558 RepID=A0A315AVJ0_PRUYE|nr:F-box protein SKIP23-like [Prunus yedoensis var. nudiflora]